MSPQIEGLPIEIEFAPQLRAHAGKLVIGNTQRGREVHAGTFIRRRRIVLDAALKGKTSELARILIHELFHFVWVRLGNPKRRAFEGVLRREIRAGAPGELGWSAEHLKIALLRRDPVHRTKRWREYACESFCDTAAWIFSGTGRHGEFTLPSAQRRERRAWFERMRLTQRISV